jgi:hypothetical protein
MNVKRGVNLFISCILSSLRWAYRSRPVSFSSINYIESLSTDGRDDVGPLVGLVGIGVVSEVSTSSRPLW